METSSANDYNEWANVCAQNADSVTKKLFEALVADEERHFDQYDVEMDNLPSMMWKWTTSKNSATITWRCNPLSAAKLWGHSIPPKKKVVICGSSKIARKRADLLLELGIDVFNYTDLKRVRNRSINFVPLHHLNESEEWFIVNFISKRGVRESVRAHFMNLGFVEGQDFILAP
jgi:hypothetical protein